MIIRMMNYSHNRISWNLPLVVVLLATLCSSITLVGSVVTSGANGDNDNEGPPGLVDIKNVEDLVAEASNAADTQKREIPSGGLSNSYGEPIPADSYGPPNLGQDHGGQQNHGGPQLGPIPIPISDGYGPPPHPDNGLPVPVYGVPDDLSNHIKYPAPPPDIPPPLLQLGGPPFQSHGGFGGGIPHETYGPPKTGPFAQAQHGGPNFSNFPQKHHGQYHGPPPPPNFNRPPKPQYGPPKFQHLPPKHAYGPPKQHFGQPKQQYGPPKFNFGPPKQHFSPPKLNFGPPKFGPQKPLFTPARPDFVPPKLNFNNQQKPPPFFNKQHPVYGPPIAHIGSPIASSSIQFLKPSFPVPDDSYGPPGKPVGPDDIFSSHQLILPDQAYGPPIGIHHGPPQPDPNPKPAHPGIPAPPTPPHILYDGWTPIPGLISKPPSGGNIQLGLLGGGHDSYGPPPLPLSQGSFSTSLHSGGSGHDHGSISSGISGSYGVPGSSFGASGFGGGLSSGSISSGVSGSYGVPSASFGSSGFGGGLSTGSGSSGISGSYGIPAATYGIPGFGVSSSAGLSSGISQGDHSSQSAGSFITGGYSSVSGNEGLQGIDLNSILGSSQGGSGIGLQGSKTVFEAHYTEGGNGHGSLQSSNLIPSGSYGAPSGGGDSSLSVIQSLGFDINGGGSGGHSSLSSSSHTLSGFGSSGHGSSSGGGPYPGPRQLGGSSNSFSSNTIGLIPPSGIYGVPPGGQYGIPPPPPPHNNFKLPSLSFGGSSGSFPPKHPISFREPVPQGLIENIGHSVAHKDALGIDDSGFNGALAYLPPPVSQQSFHDNSGSSHSSSFSDTFGQNSAGSFSIQASIEPTHLFSLPSVNSPVNFVQGHQSGGNSYSSNLDSYHAPIASVADSYGSHSIESSVSTSLDSSNSISSGTSVIGSDAASLAAAILKNCPYHKALYEAAKNVDQNNPSALASSYVASLSSLDANVASSQSSSSSSSSSSSNSNSFNLPAPGSNSVNYHTSDLSSASNTLVASNIHTNELNSLSKHNEKNEESFHKGKSYNGQQLSQQNNQQQFQGSSEGHQNFESFKSLAIEAGLNQQNFFRDGQTLTQVYDSSNGIHNIPVQGQLGAYTLQIQSADGLGQSGPSESVSHDQVLSEGLLQSILQAIEQPQQTQIIPQQPSKINLGQSGLFDLNQAPSGLTLPDGYEVVPQSSNLNFDIEKELKKFNAMKKQRGDQNAEEENNDSNSQASIRSPVIIVAPEQKDTYRYIPITSNKSGEKGPEIVTPLSIIDDNEIAVYFNSNKNEVNSDYNDDSEVDPRHPHSEDGDIISEEDATETITEISVETSISASDDEPSKNAQQYGEESRGNVRFGDKISKSESQS